MKTVVEYNRKIKTGHTLCPALKGKKKKIILIAECMRMADLNLLHYKQIQYEFCSKEHIFFFPPTWQTTCIDKDTLCT